MFGFGSDLMMTMDLNLYGPGFVTYLDVKVNS